ncbi:MAG: DUF2997 domain-containing protein [Phycisphaerales bacterium]
MARPEIDVKIDKSGRVTIKVSGISGEPCLKLAAAITEIVGKLQSRELTPEYHADSWQATVTTEESQRVRTRFE